MREREIRRLLKKESHLAKYFVGNDAVRALELMSSGAEVYPGSAILMSDVMADGLVASIEQRMDRLEIRNANLAALGTSTIDMIQLVNSNIDRTRISEGPSIVEIRRVSGYSINIVANHISLFSAAARNISLSGNYVNIHQTMVSGCIRGNRVYGSSTTFFGPVLVKETANFEACAFIGDLSNVELSDGANAVYSDHCVGLGFIPEGDLYVYKVLADLPNPQNARELRIVKCLVPSSAKRYGAGIKFRVEYLIPLTAGGWSPYRRSNRLEYIKGQVALADKIDESRAACGPGIHVFPRAEMAHHYAKNIQYMYSQARIVDTTGEIVDS